MMGKPNKEFHWKKITNVNEAVYKQRCVRCGTYFTRGVGKRVGAKIIDCPECRAKKGLKQ